MTSSRLQTLQQEQLSLLTASAERMEVKKNEEVALFGEVPNGFQRGTRPNLQISFPEQIGQELGN